MKRKTDKMKKCFLVNIYNGREKKEKNKVKKRVN